MHCGNCGRPIGNFAKFCTGCGTPIRKRKVCPMCSYLDGVDKVYCAQCGTLLKTLWIRGERLSRIPRMSLYEGMPKVGIAKGTGELILCDDRILFDNHLGDTMGDVYSAVGMSGSAEKAKRNLHWEFRYADIASILLGKYAGVFASIVLHGKDGRTYSFSGSVSNDTIRNAAKLMNEYLRYV